MKLSLIGICGVLVAACLSLRGQAVVSINDYGKTTQATGDQILSAPTSMRLGMFGRWSTLTWVNGHYEAIEDGSSAVSMTYEVKKWDSERVELWGRMIPGGPMGVFIGKILPGPQNMVDGDVKWVFDAPNKSDPFRLTWNDEVRGRGMIDTRSWVGSAPPFRPTEAANENGSKLDSPNPFRNLKPPDPKTTEHFLHQLKDLSVKPTVIDEIRRDQAVYEEVVGIAELDFGRKVIFTNRRVISVSPILFVGINLELDSGGHMVWHGGNFQIPNTQIDHICFAPSRINKSSGALDAPKEITKLLNQIGPGLSKALWPYELQIVSSSSEVLNRFYSVSAPQAEQIAIGAKSANVRIFVIQQKE